MQDSITRTIVSKVGLEAAWNAFGTPEGMSTWFADRIEGAWHVGGEAVLIWGEHRCRIRIVALDLHERFAYEWVPGVACAELIDGRMTRVEFSLAANPDGGTTITMVESGFASLPAEFYAEAVGNNDKGWTEELAKLEKLLSI